MNVEQRPITVIPMLYVKAPGSNHLAAHVQQALMAMAPPAQVIIHYYGILDLI